MVLIERLEVDGGIMPDWDIKDKDGVLREKWRIPDNLVQYYNGDGTPNGVPVAMTPEQVKAVTQYIERRDLFPIALNAYTINEAYLALVAAGTATTPQTIAQVGRLTEQINVLMKLVLVDVLKLPGSQG